MCWRPCIFGWLARRCGPYTWNNIYGVMSCNWKRETFSCTNMFNVCRVTPYWKILWLPMRLCDFDFFVAPNTDIKKIIGIQKTNCAGGSTAGCRSRWWTDPARGWDQVWETVLAFCSSQKCALSSLTFSFWHQDGPVATIHIKDWVTTAWRLYVLGAYIY